MSEFKQTMSEVTLLTRTLESIKSAFASLPPLPPSPPYPPISPLLTTAALNDLQFNIQHLYPTLARFRTRLTELDPVTNLPRYGENMTAKVTGLLSDHDALVALSSDVLTAPVFEYVAQYESKVKAEGERMERGEEEEREGEEERRAKEEEEEELRAVKEKAAAARRAVVERDEAIAAFNIREREEQRVKEEELRIDREWVASVGKGGGAFKGYLTALPASARVIVGLIFKQIKQHPDKENFRKMKLDNPKFLQDVGDFEGGKEVFIAAGFKLQTVETDTGEFAKCLVLAEPNLETDFDGWSDWFDRIKECVEICEAIDGK